MTGRRIMPPLRVDSDRVRVDSDDVRLEAAPGEAATNCHMSVKDGRLIISIEGIGAMGFSAEEALTFIDSMLTVMKNGGIFRANGRSAG